MIQYLLDYFNHYMPDEERLKFGYAKKGISFIVNIDTDGNFLGITNLLKDPKERPKTYVVPDDGSPETSGASPRFLWGKLKYFFNYKIIEVDKKGNKKIKNSKNFFESSKKLHITLLHNLVERDNVFAKAICSFFEKESSIERTFSDEEIKLYGSAFFAFKCEDEILFLNSILLSSWDDYMEKGVKVFSAFSGNEGKVLEGPHPQLAPSEVPGTGTGAPLVSRKEDVESFKLEMPLPLVTQTDAHKYVTALKYLATVHEMREVKTSDNKKKDNKNNKKSSKKLVVDDDVSKKKKEYPYYFYRTSVAEDFILVHWAEDKEKVDFDPFFSPEKIGIGLDDKELKATLHNMCSGLGFKNWDENPIVHIFSLVGTSGRIRVVFSAHEFLNDIFKNATQHLERIKIVGLERYPSFYAILNTVLPEGGNRKQFHNLAQGIILSIMTGVNYPDYLYNAVLEKIKTGISSGNLKTVSFDFKNCVSILKAVLIKNYNMEVTFKMNELEKNTAYLLGRVYAAAWLSVDRDHRSNMDKVMERWYRVAMETPAVAYAQYLQSARIHGVNNYRIADIMKDITEPYPERLSVREQGMWTLGFYHEVAKQFKLDKPKEENSDNVAVENEEDSTDNVDKKDNANE